MQGLSVIQVVCCYGVLPEGICSLGTFQGLVIIVSYRRNALHRHSQEQVAKCQEN